MLQYFVVHPSSLTWFAHILIVTALSIRVIMRRPATGVALAWLLLITAAPFVGALVYLLIGERRIRRSRTRGIESLRIDYRRIADAAIREGLTDVDWSRHTPAIRAMDRCAPCARP